ncbi:MAG: deoxyribose-phosphate aldolase, partial [Pseudomonadota bacterium]
MEVTNLKPTTLPVAPTMVRNPGLPLDLNWVAKVQANSSAIERRCSSLTGRRTVKKDH